MQCPRSYRKKINRHRKIMAKRGRKNGSLGWTDDPGMENLLVNSKRNYRRHRLPAPNR